MHSCSNAHVDTDSIVVTSTHVHDSKKSIFTKNITLAIALILYYVWKRRIETCYIRFALCKGLNATDGVHRILGLPRELPSQLFVSVHHRHHAGISDYFSVALLSSFDRVVTVINPLPWHGVSTIINAKTIKGKSETLDEKFFSIYDFMGPRTAVVVYTDRRGSPYFGHTGMILRPGIFAASLAHQIPIMDVAIVQATPVYHEMTTHVSMHVPKQLNESPNIHCSFTYKTWRDAHASDIEFYRLDTQSVFRNKISALESMRTYTDSDAYATCSRESVFQKNAEDSVNEINAAIEHGLS